jgi:hypothetical protein
LTDHPDRLVQSAPLLLQLLQRLGEIHHVSSPS